MGQAIKESRPFIFHRRMRVLPLNGAIIEAERFARSIEKTSAERCLIPPTVTDGSGPINVRQIANALTEKYSPVGTCPSSR